MIYAPSRSSGMVLETDERIWHRFVETGTMHVLVVSAEIQNLYIFLYIHVLYFLILKSFLKKNTILTLSFNISLIGNDDTVCLGEFF
jgi:hypothetical protein